MTLFGSTKQSGTGAGTSSTMDPAPANPTRFGPLLGPAAFAAAGALLLASAVTLNLFLSSLTDARHLVLRASSILRNAAELHAYVRAAETGQRGYILTGERRYLSPYEQAIGRVWDSFRQLELAVQDPEQVSRLRRARPIVEAKLDELARTVELRSQGFEEALAVVRTDLGQQLMEDIETAISEFERAEQDILVARTRKLEQQATWTAWLAALMAILALVSAVVGVAWISRQNSNVKLLEAERRFRRDLERQVEDRTIQLTQVNRELDAFAYTISHDLRAPLRAMHGYADALAEDYGLVLPEEGQRFTRRIISASDRMENLIQDILAYSRLAREEVSVRPVSLEVIVDKVITGAETLVRASQAKVIVERPLPVVMAHPPTLSQVIENLLSNSIKFVQPGQTPEVVISAELRGEQVRLWIEDNGIGIDPAHQERVFQPFQRLHGVEAYPGTGIGLAIVCRSIERMGGRSGLVSTPGSGSRFWIELDAGPGEMA